MNLASIDKFNRIRIVVIGIFYRDGARFLRLWKLLQALW
jgi:hypothetical protein